VAEKITLALQRQTDSLAIAARLLKVPGELRLTLDQKLALFDTGTAWR